jgi:diguanylate cyclase (GGDEF)-like protein
MFEMLDNDTYYDPLTGSFNRFYGMFILQEWIHQKKQFALVFIDLDNIKYVNDVHGSQEGDEYIKNVCKHLLEIEGDSAVCRLGGNEFMLLVADLDYEKTQRLLYRVSNDIEKDKTKLKKDYWCSISVGIVALDENNDLSSSSILSLADERMYEHKRSKKRKRLANKNKKKES